MHARMSASIALSWRSLLPRSTLRPRNRSLRAEPPLFGGMPRRHQLSPHVCSTGAARSLRLGPLPSRAVLRGRRL